VPLRASISSNTSARTSRTSTGHVADQLDVSLAEIHAALAYYDRNVGEMDDARDHRRELDDELEQASKGPERVEPCSMGRLSLVADEHVDRAFVRPSLHGIALGTIDRH